MNRCHQGEVGEDRRPAKLQIAPADSVEEVFEVIRDLAWPGVPAE